MILHRFPNDGICFTEMDDAVRQLSERNVVFHAHPPLQSRIGPNSVIYNLDFLGIHVDPKWWIGYEVWDFCLRNLKQYPTSIQPIHVPVGYHPSMERFVRRPPNERDVDVVFCGSGHPRRAKVLHALKDRGLNVVHISNLHGPERDEVFARSKLALNMFFHAAGVFTVVRQSHLVANKMPVLGEHSPETPDWVSPTVPYDKLVDTAVEMLEDITALDARAEAEYERFTHYPMKVPS